MLTFLEANGYQIAVTDPELGGWIVGLSGGLTPDELAERIRPRLILAKRR